MPKSRNVTRMAGLASDDLLSRPPQIAALVFRRVFSSFVLQMIKPSGSGSIHEASSPKEMGDIDDNGCCRSSNY